MCFCETDFHIFWIVSFACFSISSSSEEHPTARYENRYLKIITYAEQTEWTWKVDNEKLTYLGFYVLHCSLGQTGELVLATEPAKMPHVQNAEFKCFHLVWWCIWRTHISVARLLWNSIFFKERRNLTIHHFTAHILEICRNVTSRTLSPKLTAANYQKLQKWPSAIKK